MNFSVDSQIYTWREQEERSNEITVCGQAQIINKIFLISAGHWPISRVFTNGPGGWGSIPG